MLLCNQSQDPSPLARKTSDLQNWVSQPRPRSPERWIAWPLDGRVGDCISPPGSSLPGHPSRQSLPGGSSCSAN